MKVHKLKTETEYFNQNLLGKKPCTIRKNDRNFEIGDLVIKEEIDEKRKKTGRTSEHVIINIIDFPKGLKKGYVLLILGRHYIHSHIERIPFDEIYGEAVIKQWGIYYIIEDNYEFNVALRQGYELSAFNKKQIEYEISRGWIEEVKNWRKTKLYYEKE